MIKIDLEFYKKNGYLIVKDFLLEDDIYRILYDSKSIFFRQFIEKQYIKKCALEDISEENFNKLLCKLFEEDIDCFSNSGKQVQHLV